MIIVIKKGTAQDDVKKLVADIESMGNIHAQTIEGE